VAQQSTIQFLIDEEDLYPTCDVYTRVHSGLISMLYENNEPASRKEEENLKAFASSKGKGHEKL